MAVPLPRLCAIIPLMILALSFGTAHPMLAEPQPLISPRAAPLFISSAATEPLPLGSLFSSETVLSSLLAPQRPAPPLHRQGVSSRSIGAQVALLLSLIARAEAGRDGYDAVQHGARIRPPARPTQMTLAEIDAWIDATPGQPHAIGRYQFIPPTLRRVARIGGYGPDTRFTPALQDSLALVLLEEAGLRAFQAGELDRPRFMHNLARIWAGLPLPNGRSYYHGYAGNRATMEWDVFETGMAAIWPE